MPTTTPRTQALEESNGGADLETLEPLESKVPQASNGEIRMFLTIGVSRDWFSYVLPTIIGINNYLG